MKKKLLVLAASTLLALSSCGIVSFNGNNQQVKNDIIMPIENTYACASFKSGQLAFELDKEITSEINTFEATIRLDTSYKQNGVIFGNYNYYNCISTQIDYINFEINASGHFVVNWAKVKVEFNNFDFRTGEYVHLAFARNGDSLSLYVNGALVQRKDGIDLPKTHNTKFRHCIGIDETNGEKPYFDGEIASITCYESYRGADLILDDYQNVKEISFKTRGLDLLFHALLPLGADVIEDTSNYCNNARAITNNYFYESPRYEAGQYSFGIVGDTQAMARNRVVGMDSLSDWAIENKEKENLQAMLYMGDIGDGKAGSSESEFSTLLDRAAKSLGKMDNKVPYAFVPGNHDYKADSNYRDLTMFNKHFPYSKHSSDPHWKGSYAVDQIQNSWYTFEVEGIKYLIMCYEFGPEEEVLNWADDVISSHKDHRVIAITHGFLNAGGGLYEDETYLSAYWYFSRHGAKATSSRDMWDRHLSKHDNLFMILCGHSVGESLLYREFEGQNGNTVMAFRADFSYILNSRGAEGILSLFRFDENDSTLYINTFSVERGDLYNIQNQMRINFSTFTRFTASYYHAGKEVKAK